ncbi:MAG: undecaprenyl-diphosphate phosphatase [Candidatus Altiarchaeales archaeon]|nr:undecaprenyl-diphosphate phosphatase [Candidatus Altiarchaeales archaeon]
MDLLSAVVLGVIQGITEWLPVSSSAQNIFFMVGFLKFDPQSAFTFSAFLHLGTLLAVVLRFRRELVTAVQETVKGRADRLMSFIVVATFFSALTGLPTYFFLKESFLEHQGVLLTALVGLLLIATGVVLHKSRKKFGSKNIAGATTLDAVWSGLVQGVAVLPGVSRSGVTAAAMLFRKFRQEDALELTFIISIPAVFGLVGVELLHSGIAGVDLPSLFVGIFVSFVVGYLTIDLLIKFAHKIRFDLFCILFGLVTVLASLPPLLLS